MPFPNFQGRKRLWTREKVTIGLAVAARNIRGPLPCCDSEYARLKKGRLDWPPAGRVLEFYHSMARGYLAAGVNKNRCSCNNLAWESEEEDYLLDNAGSKTLKEIGSYLRRSPQACRCRLHEHGVKARQNQGYLSAAELAKEYRCPYHRVRMALQAGQIKGTFNPRGNRWEIDPGNIDNSAKQILTAPKLKSYRTTVPDLGDYYQRYGLKRTMIDGKLKVVEVSP